MSTSSPLLRRLGSAAVTLAVVAGAGALTAGGAALLASRAASAPPPPLPAPVEVALTSVAREAGYVVSRRFVGQVAAARSGELGFELPGRIAEVLAEEGDRVAAGTVLARLDVRSLIADRAAAVAEREALRAQAELARLTTERRVALESRGHAAAQALDEARLQLAQVTASIAAAEARIAGIDVALAKSDLIAPFAAEIGARRLDPGATVAPGTPVLSLFADAAPELRVGLPAELAARLVPGATATAELAGRTVPARLVRLRPDLDPATRTREAVFALDLPEGAAPGFGTTAALTLEERVAEPGFWAPLAALREGVRGSWEVIVAAPGDEGPVARPEAVEVLHADGTRAFLRGALPDGAPVVAEGAHRVTPGQRLTPAEG
mgnify:CR=1 FL=1